MLDAPRILRISELVIRLHKHLLRMTCIKLHRIVPFVLVQLRSRVVLRIGIALGPVIQLHEVTLESLHIQRLLDLVVWWIIYQRVEVCEVGVVRIHVSSFVHCGRFLFRNVDDAIVIALRLEVAGTTDGRAYVLSCWH